MAKQNNFPAHINEDEERQKYYPLWLWFGELLLEPFLLAFFVFLLFARTQEIIKIASNFPDFIQRLNQDMDSNMIYFIFIILFGVWVFFKAKKVSRDWRLAREESELHSAMLKELRELRRDFKTLVKEGIKEYEESKKQ